MPEDSSEQLPLEGTNGLRGPDATSGVQGPLVNTPDEQELFLPVHGLVRLTRKELALLDHPAVQHLAEVNQLGQVFYVYRGATHKRIEHALGTLHCAELMCDSIVRNARLGIKLQQPTNWTLDTEVTDLERAFIRLAALIHDIGHIPAGHTLEDELGLLDPHDASRRLDLVLAKTEWFQATTTPLRSLLDELYAEEAERTGTGASPSDIVKAIVSKDTSELPRDSGTFRLGVCRDIVGNTICADLLDYLHRDWHHIGKTKYFDARLLDYMEIRRGRDEDQTRSELVVNLRGLGRVRTDAVTGILGLLESRYELAEIALFHKTKLTAAAMLERAIAEVGAAMGEERFESWLRELPNQLLELSDREFLILVRETARSAPGSRAEAAAHLIQTLLSRQLYTPLFISYEYDLAHLAEDVRARYAPGRTTEQKREAARNRLSAVSNLEQDFGLSTGSIVMYCPPRDMNSKIAGVKILFNDHVYALSEYEGDRGGDQGLTGGHLAAQLRRFRRLWRIHLAMDEGAYQTLEKDGRLPTLRRAIEALVVGRLLGGGSLDDESIAIARDLAGREGSPLSGREVVPIGARHGASLERYPTGAPTLRSLVVDG